MLLTDCALAFYNVEKKEKENTATVRTVGAQIIGTPGGCSAPAEADNVAQQGAKGRAVAPSQLRSPAADI